MLSASSVAQAPPNPWVRPPVDARAFVAFFGPVRPNDNLAIKGANNVIVTVSFAILGNAVPRGGRVWQGERRRMEDKWAQLPSVCPLYSSPRFKGGPLLLRATAPSNV